MGFIVDARMDPVEDRSLIVIPVYAGQWMRGRCFRKRVCVFGGLGDSRSYTGSGLSKDNSSTSCVCYERSQFITDDIFFPSFMLLPLGTRLSSLYIVGRRSIYLWVQIEMPLLILISNPDHHYGGPGVPTCSEGTMHLVAVRLIPQDGTKVLLCQLHPLAWSGC